MIQINRVYGAPLVSVMQRIPHAQSTFAFLFLKGTEKRKLLTVVWTSPNIGESKVINGMGENYYMVA